MSRIPTEIVTRVREAARRLGGDEHAIAHELDLSPDLVRRALASQHAVRALTPAQVADLRAAFRRRTVTAGEWFQAQAAVYGVGHATVRRAVYGFSSYSEVTCA